MPIDPGRDWLAAGITGLQRQREWDAVATSEGDGTPGDEIAFVALADATFVLESGAADPSHASALEQIAADRVSGAYAAHAHRLRGDMWELSVLAL